MVGIRRPVRFFNRSLVRGLVWLVEIIWRFLQARGSVATGTGAQVGELWYGNTWDPISHRYRRIC